MRIGILTSGGDAPGMNAAVRTVAVAGVARNHEVWGIHAGYEGLLGRDAARLPLAQVDGISRLGGTILGSSRSASFPTPEGQARAKESLRALGLDALVVVGGNGSLTGAHVLGAERPCTIVGIPASIDNDIGHCGLAIGVDTAVNTIVEACDRISDTARSHRRAFVVEVMGRQSGYLAMRAGLAAEADAILYGERGLSEDELVARLRELLRARLQPERGQARALIIKAEGVKVPTGKLVARLSEHLKQDVPGVDIRETVLGHVVRGGNPSALDRLIAQRLGYAALVACESGVHDVMVSWDVPGGFGQKTADPSVRAVPIADVLAETAKLLDGSSPVARRRMELLAQVENLLAL
ncbi:MAG TPA: 6-phosphofructokinase [Polyangia bacterium]|nr:6-phosphofructokinase [Polyangia bacterium]